MPDFEEPVQLLNNEKRAVLRLTGEPQPTMSLTDDESNNRIVLNAANGNLFMRAKKKPGQLIGDLVAMLDGDGGNLFLGGGSTDGDVVLLPGGANNQKSEEATIHLSAGASLFVMRGANNQNSIRIDGGQANFWIGGNGMDGDVVIYPSTVSNDAPAEMSSIHLSGNGSVISIRSGGQETIRIDGKAGDIILANADGAEEFEVDDGAEPGSVLIIEAESRLRLADRPYDRRVAGIVSGAAGIRPGIVLGRGRKGLGVPVALFGRVNCRIDASYGPVVAGDLLTTSETPGHAMRAEPGTRSLGAVIGKALRALDSGRDFVPVLVALQ
jgi:hypothetical protein